jgi:hypothetical protein
MRYSIWYKSENGIFHYSVDNLKYAILQAKAEVLTWDASKAWVIDNTNQELMFSC